MMIYENTVLVTLLALSVEALDDCGYRLLPRHYCRKEIHRCTGGQPQPGHVQVFKTSYVDTKQC